MSDTEPPAELPSDTDQEPEPDTPGKDEAEGLGTATDGKLNDEPA